MKLSAVIITKNEAHNIKRCLQSVAFADERLVVDAESTDETAAIANSLGAQVTTRPWPGNHGAQKNFAASLARGEWLLFIDADEEVLPALREEILMIINNNPPVDFYWLKIVTVFLERPLTHLYGHNPRLFKKSAGHWTESHIHEQVITSGSTPIHLGDKRSVILKSPLWHHSHKTIASYLPRMQRYAALDAQEMRRTNHHRSGRAVAPNLWLPAYLALRQGLKLYFYRQGWRDGWAGFMWSLLSGYYEWTMGREYLRLGKQ